MELDAFFFAMAIPAVVFAGMSKGGFGAAVSFAATPFLTLILTPGQAIGLMLPLLIVMDVTAMRIYWGKWDLKVALRFIYGAVLGIVVAGLIYRYANPDIFRLLIGLMAIGFVAFQAAKARGWIKAPEREMGPVESAVWGSIGGFTSFVSHAGGPPASIYLLSQNLDKVTYQATSVLMFFSINMLKVIPYALLGIFSAETFKADILLIPASIVGVLIGVYLHKRISEAHFFAITYVFLLITGAKLVFSVLM
jgi:uncharacterized membrane protein YfcA